MWIGWYQSWRRYWHECARESAIYDRLKKGPVFEEAIEYTIRRKDFIEDIRQLIMPAKTNGVYRLIIGGYGAGKTSLIKLAVDGMDEPKGVIYADMVDGGADEADVTRMVREAIGWSPDPVIDSSQRNCYNSLLSII
jgi:hypothetical protein